MQEIIRKSFFIYFFSFISHREKTAYSDNFDRFSLSFSLSNQLFFFFLSFGIVYDTILMGAVNCRIHLSHFQFFFLHSFYVGVGVRFSSFHFDFPKTLSFQLIQQLISLCLHTWRQIDDVFSTFDFSSKMCMLVALMKNLWSCTTNKRFALETEWYFTFFFFYYLRCTTLKFVFCNFLGFWFCTNVEHENGK